MFSADLGGAPPAATPAATDPPFQKVALLLHGDGTNGAQNNTFVDYSYPGGYAVSFDGTGDYLTVDYNSNLNLSTGDWTVECWFNSNGTANQYIFDVTSPSSGFGQAAVAYFGGTFYALSSNGNWISATTGGSITANSWNHIAYVRYGTSFKLYVNGISVISYTSSSSLFTPSGTEKTYIGDYGATGYSVNGYISNFRVVKGTALYTSNFTPSNQPLTAVSGTQLLTCQSATIVDNSPNAFAITVNGNAAAVSSKTITRTGNVAQGTFSPFSLPEGQWSNYFSSTTSYLTTPATTSYDISNGNFTMEAWVNYTEVNNGGVLGRHDSSGTGDWGWYYASASQKWRIIGNNGATIIQSSATWVPTVGTWYHIALCRSGNNFYFFINGTQLGTTQTNTITFTYTPSISTYVGSLSDGLYTRGYLSNVRFIKGTALYTSNFTPSTTPLTAVTNTQLLTCQSNRFIDKSSNNSALTPQSTNPCRVTAFSPFAPSAAYSASTNGGSAYFDGSGDYLYVAGNSSTAMSTGDWTVEGWFYMPSGAAYNKGIITSCPSTTPTSSANFYLAAYSATQMYINVGGAGGGQAVTYNQGVWNHFAVVRSVNTATLYVNGVSYWTAGVSGFNWTDQNFIVGDWWTGGNYINAYISNIRIVKGTALYTSNFTPPTAPLTAVANTQLLLNCTNAGIIDNAGKNDIETVGNAQVSTSVKKYGTGSMSFNGTTDYLVATGINAMQFTGDFTMEFWVYQNSATTYSDWVQDGNSSGGFGVQLYNGVVYVTRQGVANPASAYFTGYYDQWVHIAATRQSGTIRLFLNGILKASGSDSTSVSSSSSVWVGKSANRANYTNGYIDDLRITKGQALYTSNFTPPTQAFPNV